MTRECWVYPDDGSPPYRKGERPQEPRPGYATILPDLPDFQSPIDGKWYSGRAGLREHCKKHDVVPNADLKGLPTLMSNSDTRSPEQKRADAANRKQHIINQVNKHYR
jgi:hypothetical protein